MTVYTFSKAHQNFASLLDTASKSGEVLIKKQEGRIYSLKQKASNRSPLEVKGIKTKISTSELIDIIKESRSIRRRSQLFYIKNRRNSGDQIKKGQKSCS